MRGIMQRRPVLVIDDDPRSCELITAILTSAGFEVRSATDGASGIELAGTLQPSAILLDMMMPGMDGLATLACLKRDPLLGNVPVIGMTASTDLTYTGKAFRAGANFFVSKPLSRASLVRVVELAVCKVEHDTPARHHRRYPRFQADLAVRCLVGAGASGSRELVGTSGNLSLGGLLLLLHEELAPGTLLGLRLGLPEKAVLAAGKVVWQDQKLTGDGRLRHGIQFVRFGSDSSLVGYRGYLSGIAPSAGS
jgi:CheY-like chemotaxis protein